MITTKTTSCLGNNLAKIAWEVYRDFKNSIRRYQSRYEWMKTYNTLMNPISKILKILIVLQLIYKFDKFIPKFIQKDKFLWIAKYISKHIKKGPGWSGSVDWVLAWEPKGCWFKSQSRHEPGLWARSPGGGVGEATTHWCFSPSISQKKKKSIKKGNSCH